MLKLNTRIANSRFKASFNCKYVCPILNQDLSVLYGGSTLNYVDIIFVTCYIYLRVVCHIYIPAYLCALHIIIPVSSRVLRVHQTRGLAHLHLPDLHGEIGPIYQTSDLQMKRILMRRK